MYETTHVRIKTNRNGGTALDLSKEKDTRALTSLLHACMSTEACLISFFPLSLHDGHDGELSPRVNDVYFLNLFQKIVT